MKFFLPDSLDVVDPGFSFDTEGRRADRLRQRSEMYAYEVFRDRVCDGLLISKGIVDGTRTEQPRYSQGQRCRLLREGAHRFFRLSKGAIPIMGDSGAYTYLDDAIPPFSVDEVVDFYGQLGVDMGLSVDHVIVPTRPHWDGAPERVPSDLRRQQELNLDLAERFLRTARSERSSFEPVGVAQAWSPGSYAVTVRALRAMGYRALALGGLATAKPDVLAKVLRAIAPLKSHDCTLHVLGVRSVEVLHDAVPGLVDSFDTTSPLRQAFKDDLHNYHTPQSRFAAIRIDPLSSQRVQRAISTGRVSQARVAHLESRCLEGFVEFEAGLLSSEQLLARLLEYESTLCVPPQSPRIDTYAALYRQTLSVAPWRHCKCEVCLTLGHHVILLRGSERSRRRGFHNVWVFYRTLESLRASTSNQGRDPSMSSPSTLRYPCLEVAQTEKRRVYVFGASGRDVSRFASVSRAQRKPEAFLGYQRGEAAAHIEDIRRYLDSLDPMLPNALVVAFDRSVHFEADAVAAGPSRPGEIIIPLPSEDDASPRPAFVVDGQQRLAALRECKRASFPIVVVGFIADDEAHQAQQFILVNSTKPLPKGLLFELLPHTPGHVPTTLAKRRVPAVLVERLNQDDGSPLRGLIRTSTCPEGLVTDLSLLKMIENSLRDGMLYRFRGVEGRAPELDDMLRTLTAFWSAVSEVFSDAWGLPPKKSRLLHGAGVCALGYLMDAIGDPAPGATPPEQGHFVRHLAPLREVCRWTNGFWDFGQHDQRRWNEVQNTHQDIRTLTKHLLGHYRRQTRSPRPPVTCS